VARSRTLAWGFGALIFLVGIPTMVFEAGLDENQSSPVLNVIFPALCVLLAGIGVLLALRIPSNPIGWLLIAEGSALALSGLAYDWAARGLEEPGSQPLVRVAAAWDTHGWPSIFAPIVALLFVFPDGRLLPGRLWRRAAVAGVVSFTAVTVGGLLSDETLDPPFESVKPLAILPSGLAGSLQGLGLLGMIVTFVLAAASVRSRFKRADYTERSQLKWLLYASALVPLAIVCGTIDGLVFDDSSDGPLTLIPFLLAIAAIPISVLVAVTRYRLYDIDRLISATVLYVLMTVVLAATFVAIILVGGVAIGGGSPFTTAAATLAVTLAFRPLRTWLQEAVDRRFNRARYDAFSRVDDFLARLRAGDEEPEEIEGVLRRALQDNSLRVYFWLSEDAEHADASGQIVDLPGPPAVHTPVRRGELMLGTVVHDPERGGEGSSIEEVIMRAGLAIEVARLRVEVRRQLAEVEASRARIAAATHEERRRLERDLHDGAQQRLVSIGLDLRHLQQGLDADDGTREGLDEAVGGLADAISELRELARGVRPGMLDEGLARALTDLASRSPLETDVQVTDERFPDEIEAAAYFVAAEGLTNAAKHSGADSVRVSAVREDGSLLVTVTDDGSGGAAASNGSGLTGLADRVAAVGGRLAVDSPSGAGTELTAEFPCA
jgi:signal transduction histidine kinase